jgi:lysophospholipase L1-like esterase
LNDAPRGVYDRSTMFRKSKPTARTASNSLVTSTDLRWSALLGALFLMVVATGAGCSDVSEGSNGPGGQGGGSTGGSSGNGGESGGGGSSVSGAGGRTFTGGSVGTGGASAGGSGGFVGTGGAQGTGGTSSGGTTGTGGSTGTGGTQGTGGMAGVGGTQATGGATGGRGGTGSGGSGTGGRAGAGGTQAMGGATGGRGGSGIGGTASTGGVTGAGGARPDGGGPDVSSDGGDAGAAYNPCPAAAGTACKVLPLGDSITEGCCKSPYGGYRIELFRQAVKDKKNVTFVGSLTNGPDQVENQTFPKRHEGHGGYTIDTSSGHSGISGQITDQALANYSPNIVLLMIGTNDINGNVDINNAPTRLGKLMDEITTNAPSALLVVSAIIPTTNDGTNQRVQTYNAAIPGLVDTRAKAGKHVVFLDNYKTFSQNSSYKTALMADGLHPNDAGYVVLGQSFYGVISTLLPPAP